MGYTVLTLLDAYIKLMMLVWTLHSSSHINSSLLLSSPASVAKASKQEMKSSIGLSFCHMFSMHSLAFLLCILSLNMALSWTTNSFYMPKVVASACLSKYHVAHEAAVPVFIQ